MKKALSKILLSFAMLTFVNSFESDATAQNSIFIGKLGHDAINRNRNKLEFWFSDNNAKLGTPIFLRIFKDKAQMELWVRGKNGRYRYMRNYRICGTGVSNLASGVYYSNAGKIGLSTKNNITIATSFPNSYNIAQKQRGQMAILPSCASAPNIGITDTDMEELFTIIYSAINNGQDYIQIQILPYAPNAFSLFREQNSKNTIMRQLRPIYDYFENKRQVPQVLVTKDGYKLQSK